MDRMMPNMQTGGYISNRSCNACGKQGSQLGGGIRFIMGGRFWVCVTCKTKLDEKRKTK